MAESDKMSFKSRGDAEHRYYQVYVSGRHAGDVFKAAHIEDAWYADGSGAITRHTKRLLAGRELLRRFAADQARMTAKQRS